MKNIGWLPYKLNPIYAGVRIRCLNPLKQLHGDGVIGLYEPDSLARYDALVCQAMYSHADAVGDDIAWKDFLAKIDLRRQQGMRLIVDDCDNHLLEQVHSPEWTTQATRIRQLMERADTLVCSTEALLSVVREQGFTQPGYVVGDAVESEAELQFGDSWLRRYLNPKRWPSLRKTAEHKAWVAQQRASGHIPLVWFGNHGVGYAEGGMLDLLKLQAQLEQMYPTRPVSLTVMSNHRGKYEQHIQPWRIPTRYIDWDRTTFLEVLRAHEVAVVPVQLNDFTRCKSNNRVATALQNGLNVVADSIPAYEPLRPYCLLDDWQNLSAYLQNHDLRKSQLQSATAYLQAHCSQAAVAQQWRQVFERLD